MPSGGLQPGLDNLPNLPHWMNPLPSIQFVFFTFSSPVTITKVTVDDVSNYDRDIWVAGGNQEPDFTEDLVTAFQDFAVVNRGDDGSDGVLVYNVKFKKVR